MLSNWKGKTNITDEGKCTISRMRDEQVDTHVSKRENSRRKKNRSERKKELRSDVLSKKRDEKGRDDFFRISVRNGCERA